MPKKLQLFQPPIVWIFPVSTTRHVSEQNLQMIPTSSFWPPPNDWVEWKLDIYTEFCPHCRFVSKVIYPVNSNCLITLNFSLYVSAQRSYWSVWLNLQMPYCEYTFIENVWANMVLPCASFFFFSQIKTLRFLELCTAGIWVHYLLFHYDRKWGFYENKFIKHSIYFNEDKIQRQKTPSGRKIVIPWSLFNYYRRL